MRRREKIVIGVVSDTHGILRPEAVEHLRGVDYVIHAGDIGAPEVLTGLAAIAPVTAVRGNNDKGLWARDLPETAVLRVGGLAIYVLHDVHELDIDPRAASVSTVIAGHSHRPMLKEEDGVLYMNPGSIGPRRFKLPITLGKLVVQGERRMGEIIRLSE